MPKLFRPKLAQAANKTTCQSTTSKSLTDGKAPSPEKPTDLQDSADPALSASSPSLSTTSHSCASPPHVENHSESHEVTPVKSNRQPPAVSSEGPTSVDIDQSTKNKKKGKSLVLSEPNRQRIELFKPKKPRVTSPKHSLEPPPDADRPLDRATVSLRSLLNWVPVNKPPPSYRLANSSISDSSEAKCRDSVKLEPPVFKTEVAIQSPGKSPTLPVDLLAPQLRLDADGNIVLDESSLVVALPETAREDNSVRHVNEETGLLNVTYSSFRTLPDRRGRRWSPRETVRFYRALNTFGRDFYLMATIFPNRSRAELKRKFSNESRKNPYLVNQALRNRRSYDLTALVPISDEDEVEDEDEEQQGSTEEHEIEQGEGKKKKRLRRKHLNSDIPDKAADQSKRKRGRKTQDTTKPKRQLRTRSSGDIQSIRHMEDSIMDTIDAVLAQSCRSPSHSNEIVQSEIQNDAPIASVSFTPNLNECTVPHHAPAIDRMLESAKRRVDLYEHCPPVDSDARKSTETSESPVTEQPLIVDLGPPYNSETEDVIPVRAVPENPKIDILLTGRKLLSE